MVPRPEVARIKLRVDGPEQLLELDPAAGADCQRQWWLRNSVVRTWSTRIQVIAKKCLANRNGVPRLASPLNKYVAAVAA
jgi:hypothetical protein